jgi:hypothetical protein
MQKDSTGLGAIVKYNETVQLNDDLLSRLKIAIPLAEFRDGYKSGFVRKDCARVQIGLKSNNDSS